jgi:hypothetical protein
MQMNKVSFSLGLCVLGMIDNEDKTLYNDKMKAAELEVLIAE